MSEPYVIVNGAIGDFAVRVILEMNMKHIALAGRVFGIAAILGAASFGLPIMPRRLRRCFEGLDTGNDGTVDLAGAKAAASKLFDKLDRDRDCTLDR